MATRKRDTSATPAEPPVVPADPPPSAAEPVALSDIPGMALQLADESGSDAAGAPEPAEPPVSTELKAIIEALVFASPEPLAPKALFTLLDAEPREDVERALASL